MMKKTLFVIFLSFFMLLGIHSESIDFNIHTTALSSVANWEQASFSAAETINGEIAAEGAAVVRPGVPDAWDGWAVSPYHTSSNSILWSFNAGMTAVSAMQLLNVYNPNEIIHTFSLWYTTDSNPNLNSNFIAMTGISLVNGNTGTAMNPIITGSKIDTSASPQRNYHVFFSSVNATAIRLNSYPNSGTWNGNFVLSEVSFQSVPEWKSGWLLCISLGILFFLKKK